MKTEPKTVRLCPELKELTRRMQLRLREKQPLVAAGDWPHWKQMALKDLVAAARGHLDALERMAADQDPTLDPLKEAADLGNRGWMIAKRLMAGMPAGKASE